jgi:hypothetical protein
MSDWFFVFGLPRIVAERVMAEIDLAADGVVFFEYCLVDDGARV